MVSTTGKFADGASFFELAHHFLKMRAVGALEMEAAADIVERSGIASNLKETQYVVWA